MPGCVQNIPGLQSFCVFASLGLASIFLLQTSWFLAWLTLDERRIREGRSGILPCCLTYNHPRQPDICGKADSKRPSNTISEVCQKEIEQNQVKPDQNISKLKLKMTSELLKQSDCSQFRRGLVRGCYSSSVFRVLVLTLSSALLAGGLYGFTKMEYKFDPNVLVPSESYFSKFLERMNTDLPSSSGYRAQVFTGEINRTHLEQISLLHSQLERIVLEGNVLESYQSWWSHFTHYLHQRTDFSVWQNLTQEDFQLVMSDFLHSKSGSKFQGNFNFESSLECGAPAPRILASSLEILYLPFQGPSHHGPARATMEDLLSSSGLPDAISFNKIYLSWETDQIIDTELWRNVGLGLCCIFLVTFILLANIQVSFMVNSDSH